jgi:hypothetical protein
MVGEDAARLRMMLQISYPLDNGIVRNWEDMIHLYDHTWKKMSIKPEECKLTVSKHHHTNFAECVLQGTTPVAPVGDAVRSDTISHLCDIAVRLGRKVTWDPKQETFVSDPDATKLMHRPMRKPWSLSRT